MEKIKFAYFGGEPIGVPVLEELKQFGYLPNLVICSPDKPVGRKQEITAPPVKVWAEENGIEVWQPLNLESQTEITDKLSDYELFIVVAYNHILPKWLIYLPKFKTLNVHPSLLPLLRGASPIRSAILKDMREEVGVTIMQIDAKMDHGPIITQKRLEISKDNWPIKGPELDKALAYLGGSLLAATLPGYISGNLVSEAQEHEYATYCGRFTKEDTELIVDINKLPTNSAAYEMFLKICAFYDSPGTWFKHKGKRIKINDAEIKNESLNILQVTPEGKNQQSFEEFINQQ